VIAIGIAGAAVYLAIDARESSVSESDVQALQQELEGRIDELGASAAAPPAETEAEAVPGQEVEPAPQAAPQAKPETGKKGKGAASEGSTGSTPNGATGSTPNGATGGDASAARLQELVEQAKERDGEGK
jgi:hypothetical protein